MNVGVTYSFKDLVGVLINAAFGVSLPLTGGNIGNGQVTIRMSQERTTHDVAADDTVMPSYVAGDNGEIDLEIQQTSSLHHALLGLYNQVKTAADADDLTGWASTVISFRTLLDGSTHVLSGVSFKKIPDKPYHASGQKITWSLMAANVSNS